jgi:hypothetical protein
MHPVKLKQFFDSLWHSNSTALLKIFASLRETK